MSKVPENRTETVFEDFKKPYTTTQALVEANRCLYCYDAPCITACPTGIDIPQFIRRIANDNTKGAAKTIFDSNILGMSCARVCPVEVLCVGSCVYNDADVPPIQIGKLQRYATDQAFEDGWGFYEAGPDTGKKVALIGGGPASISAAHRLRRYGHHVTIYERDQQLGGLNTTGVAPYKMKADRSLTEVDWVLSIGGVEVKSGVDVPKDVSWDDLRRDYDAIFIGFGLGRDRYMDLENADASNIYGAVDYITKMKLGEVEVSSMKHAVVVGGGNTAIDAVRELVGIGIPSVTMIYRGNEVKMSGYAHEWIEAKKENVKASWHSQPVAFVAENGSVTAVTCRKMDENKQEIEGSEFDIPADLVLFAIGQGKQGDLVSSLDGLQVEWGKIVVDAEGATGCAGVYAGGDCINGGKEVVNAVADGDVAANAIHRFISGGN
jgi:dihydropyrimidine dehydrogenase (NAD+) subunit PreT